MRPVLPLPALQCTAATPRGCSRKKLCTCSQKPCINASGGTCMCLSTSEHCLEALQHSYSPFKLRLLSGMAWYGDFRRAMAAAPSED